MTGRYRLVESIGQGGMGRVWRAADEMLHRQVAVKEMRIDGLDAEDTRTRRERTLREARATARIDHPNVVRVYDVVDEGERLWIVMELVAGRSLERIMAEDGPIGPREAARIGLGLVAALREVHAGGVLHRDIKPGNVLVESRAGRVVLTDFGIAAIQDAKALTMVGMLVGSPDYMAPERISGRPQGPPSDIWSLGATLCAALGGRSPFSRDTTLATLHAVLYEEPELPPAAGPLREVLAALLEKEPSVRPGLEEAEEALSPVAYPPGTDELGPVETELVEEPEEPEEPEGLEVPEPYRESPTPAFLQPWLVRAARDPRVYDPDPEPESAPAPVPDPPTEDAIPTQRPAVSGVSLVRPAVGPERPVPPPPHPARGPRTHRRSGLIAVAAVALVGAVVAAILVHGNGSSGDSATGSGSKVSAGPVSTPTDTSASASPPPSPSPTVEGTSRPPSLPPGTHQEAGGFAWATPAGWRRDLKTGAEVHYTSPDGGQELVGKSSLARGDLMRTWEDSERDAHQGQDYRKIRLVSTTFRGYPAVVWEYTFTLKGIPWHARLLGFDADGKSYQINTWYQPDVETRALKIYDEVKNSFVVL